MMEKFFFDKLFKRLSVKPFAVRYWDDITTIYGEGEPEFTLIFNKQLSEKDIIKDVSLAFGEAYMNGDIDYEGDIRKVLDLAFSNKDLFKQEGEFLSKLARIKPKSIKKNKRDIKYHYDIGNDFYKLWLDDSMTYSCAYFEHPEDSLYQAQINKVEYILKKLNLKAGERILDIGSGWGELIIRAAKEYRVKSMGITLSEEQYRRTKERISEEKLEDLVEVELMDYRELATSGKKFDKLVSVGMLEHVGHASIPEFMRTSDKLLKPGGVFLLHSITKQFENETNAWIEGYIFPGGYIPSVREVVHTLPDYDFYIKDMESLRLHYAKTLECWADNFEKNIDRVRTKFDERFIRMWRIYLNSCVDGFRYRVVDIHQFLLEKGINNDLPMSRHYLYQ